MTTFSASQIKTLIADFNKKLNLVMPTGDYSAVRQFPDGLTFASKCKFNNGTMFGDDTKFGSYCEFGRYVEFGDNTKIGEQATVGHNAVLGTNCHIDSNSRFGDSTMVGSRSIIESHVYIGNYANISSNSKIGNQVRFGHSCSLGGGDTTIHPTLMFGADLNIRPGTKLITGAKAGGDQFQFNDVIVDLVHKSMSNALRATPVLTFGGGGSSNRTTYFFNTKDGVFVRSGCFRGTLKQFRAKVKRDCRSPNSVKRLQYLGFANIVCVTWGYKDQVE